MTIQPAADRRRHRAFAGTCAGLLVLFAVLGYSAVVGTPWHPGKSATYDEPLHAVGGYLKRHHDDFRINPEDPSLFGLLASVPHGAGALDLDLNAPSFTQTVTDIRYQWSFVVDTLYRTPGNEPDHFLHRSRFMFVLLGVGLGTLVCWWSWKQAGPLAAAVATCLFALDPNFLAHAPIVKNDVALGLLMLALGYTLWQFGRRATWWRLALLGLICGAAINVKFSAVLFAPIAIVLLVVRALMPAPWRIGSTIELRTVAKRLILVPVSCVALAACAWLFTWGVYGFRFAPMSDGVLFDTQLMVRESRVRELVVRHGRAPTVAEFEAHGPSARVRLLLWMMDHRVLPQGWLFGFLYTYATTLTRGAYIMGQTSTTGWWYYFPLTMLFKTPVATLIAVALGGTLALGRIFVPRVRWYSVARQLTLDVNSPAGPRLRWLGRFDAWAAACLAVPPGIYFLAALTTNLNLGVRHVLPVYPFAYVAVGVVAGAMWRLQRRWTTRVGGALAVALAAETVIAYPDYLAFFNVLSGGSRGGFKLLSDSNLDWGQELKRLADWRKDHDDRPLYLSYFGTADPEYYLGSYTNLPGGYTWGPPIGKVDRPGYVAVSATNLQGVYIGEEEFSMLRESHTPIEILGGAIYIYEWPTPAQSSR
jgi:hypothetical protein